MTTTTSKTCTADWCEIHDPELDQCTRSLVEFADMGTDLIEDRPRAWEDDGERPARYVFALVPDLDGNPQRERLDLPADPEVLRTVAKMLTASADALADLSGPSVRLGGMPTAVREGTGATVEVWASACGLSLARVHEIEAGALVTHAEQHKLAQGAAALIGA